MDEKIRRFLSAFYGRGTMPAEECASTTQPEGGKIARYFSATLINQDVKKRGKTAGARKQAENRQKTGGRPEAAAQPVIAAEPAKRLAHPVAHANRVMMMVVDVANLVRRRERAQRRSQNGTNEDGQRGNGLECFHV